MEKKRVGFQRGWLENGGQLAIVAVQNLSSLLRQPWRTVLRNKTIFPHPVFTKFVVASKSWHMFIIRNPPDICPIPAEWVQENIIVRLLTASKINANVLPWQCTVWQYFLQHSCCKDSSLVLPECKHSEEDPGWCHWPMWIMIYSQWGHPGSPRVPSCCLHFGYHGFTLGQLGQFGLVCLAVFKPQIDWALIKCEFESHP